MRLKLQYFAEDTPPPLELPKVNYADLLKTDKEFQSFVDGERARASQTATINTEKRYEHFMTTKCQKRTSFPS